MRSINNSRPLYMLPRTRDQLIEEVMIPSFKLASQVDCMAGFFSSKILALLAPGLATFIAESQGSFRLVISPFLTPEDISAIEAGVATHEETATTALDNLLITEDQIEQHTLKCLSYLLSIGRLQIQVALMKSALFHPKVWLFHAGEDTLAVYGSSNLTDAGFRKNLEHLSIRKSWKDKDDLDTINEFTKQFSKLWENKEDYCHVIPIPKAIEKNLLKAHKSEVPPQEADFLALYERTTHNDEEFSFAEEPTPYGESSTKKAEFSIPTDLQFEDGPFAHQGKAVKAWCDAEYRGILEMATGSGKTITSMIAAHRLYESHQPLLIVIAAPYIPLIEQWCDEIASFGLKPINITVLGGATQRGVELQKIKRKFRMKISFIEAIVVSHKTLCNSQEFREALSSFDCKRLLIADEVHNLGSEGFISNPPEFFEYRLGLSATPTRQYDEEGTDALFAFFGKPVFQFKLEEAIGHCLVKYDYFVHPVSLTEDEMNEWYSLTEKIKKNAWRNEGGKPDDFLTKLLRDRRVLLEKAEGKIAALAELLEQEKISEIKHTLIYATDKAPEQLDQVTKLLNDKNIRSHQLTAEQTSNRANTSAIIKDFQEGGLQVLTAKRVLDEGVNIPQICKAYILASTTVERQWVQRRGRLLRTCDAIGKTHSTIHDFVALPPEGDYANSKDLDARALVRAELERVEEFACLARNTGREDGALSMISYLSGLAHVKEG